MHDARTDSLGEGASLDRMPRAGTPTGAPGPGLRPWWSFTLPPPFIAGYMLLSAFSVVYLPVLVADIDPRGHVLALATVSTAGTLAVIVSQPLVGWLSDRTRSRWGRRAPWIAAGALGTAILTPSLGNGTSVLGLAIAWAGVEAAVNLVRGPTAVLLVDRVPLERRGRISAVIFASFIIGSALGSVIVGPALLDGAVESWVLGAVIVIAAVPLVVGERVAERDRSGGARTDRDRADHDARAPIRVPRSEIVRVFFSRALMMLSYSMLMGFLLYTVRDHLGLEADAAARWAGLIVVVALGSSLPAAIVAGLAVDKIGRHGTAATGSLVAMALAVLAAALAPGIPAMLVMAVVVGAAYGVHGPVERVIVSRVPRDAARTAGRDLGILQLATSAAQLLAPFTAAALIEAAGYTAMYFSVAAALLVSAGLMWSVRALRLPYGRAGGPRLKVG